MPASTNVSEELLRGRVALVTGAAKRIGRAVALRLATDGADVVIHYNRSKFEADATVAEITKLGRKSVAVQADLCSLAQIKRLFQQTVEQFGRLDILVNSAANFLPAHLQRHHRENVGCRAGQHQSEGTLLLRTSRRTEC